MSCTGLELALLLTFSRAPRAWSFLHGWDRAQTLSLIPGKAALSKARALANHLSQYLPTCPWPPYLVSCCTRRGQTRFLFSFISISNMMSQREMICKGKEQKQVCTRWVLED